MVWECVQSQSNMAPQSGAKLFLGGCDESCLRNVWPNHLLQRTVCQTKSEAKVEEKASSDLLPCCQIHFQGLASVGEDVEGNLSSLLLQVRDELLQQRDPVNLQGEQEEGEKKKMVRI